MTSTFVQDKLGIWINDLKTCLSMIKTELNIVNKMSKFSSTDGHDIETNKKIEAALLIYKKKVKKMIGKLTDFLGEKISKKDGLEFLGGVKAEVQNLIKTVNTFTSSLTRDPTISSKKPTTSKTRAKENYYNDSRAQTEAYETTSFDKDTFNTKYKRHILNIEKSMNGGSARKSSSWFEHRLSKRRVQPS